MIQLPDKRIVVTGGAGFLGSHLIRRLEQVGCRHIFVPIHPEYDLTRIDVVERLFVEHRPEVVIHLAAVVGGMGANRASPGRFSYDNIEAAGCCGRNWASPKRCSLVPSRSAAADPLFPPC